jgi:hypothetical protein
MLIAVLGRKSSGKDTFANVLTNEFDFIRYAFADPLKKGIQAFFNLSNEQLYDVKLKEEIDPRWGVSPRTLFQVIGTDIFQFSIKKFIPNLKGESRNHWVILFKEWYLENLSKNPNFKVIISDARFQHEIEEIKNLGGKVVKIIRIMGEVNNDMHQSENEIDSIPEKFIDFSIENNGTINEFNNKIVSLMNILNC